ncbi:MAG: MEDS domain-containing protein [Methanosarcina sp.]|uniref:MEDS domain-containing protein n=1 Tax=Methanosarcina sp. TaxID=2213 RepID=UPI002610B5F6|nr:MEDS domain-containing protein [Methanosarcina sp.]MDD3246791.1 MEDS domain-containing protein [Methanosarcina sp.]MDD4248222.1 MEDS domain-containing protein [Methanosarcina sp.]
MWMGTNTRSSGIYIIGDIHWGTHLCQFYQTKQDLMDMLVPYFKAGLEDNEFCLWITSQPPYVEEAKEALRNSVPGIDVYLEKGQIEIIPYAHWLLEEDIFDLERLLNGWVEKLNEALANGYDGLRLTVNIPWLENENWNGFVKLEEKMDNVIENCQIMALCTYFLDRCSAIEIIDIVVNHRFSLIKREGIWEQIENPGRKKVEKSAICAVQDTEVESGESYDHLEELVKERTLQLEKAYKQLKESEIDLSEAQKMAHIGSWKWDIVTGELYWSDEIYLIFGLNPQEFRATYNAFFNYIHPNDRDFVDNAIKKALKGEQPYDNDHRIISADGEERIVHSHGEVIFDEKNTPIRMRGTLQDITERTKIEDSLILSEERYRSFIQNFTGIAFQQDKDFNLEFVKGNVEEITGYSEEELMSKKRWKKIVEKEDLPLFLKKEREIKNACSPYYGKLSYRIRCKDGKIKWVHEVYQKIPGKNGRSDNHQSTITDVTERIKAKETLVKIEDARKKEIHHRIKNNLQVISSLLDLQAEKFIHREAVTTPEILEAFRESQNRVISMSLIHEELYKGEGTDTLDFSEYLQKLAGNLLQTYSLRSKNVHLYMDLEENAFFNMDTAVPLGIIVNELVSNSLKHAFTEKERDIRIRLCREELDHEISKSFFSLTISDNGKGIPENIELGRVESLGLQLVSILVDQVDGEIELKRVRGTEFRITFWVAER